MLDLRKGRCAICDHREIIEAIPAEFTHANHEARVAVTYDPRWVFASRNADYPHGPLRMYVCRACGYTQWFAEQPGKIPIGDQYKTRIIAGPPAGPPFR